MRDPKARLENWLSRKSVQNYYLARLYYHWLYWFSGIQSRYPIVIYQMGKVGSTTLLRSLQGMELDNPIFHVHTLTGTGRQHGRSAYSASVKAQFPRSMHLLVSDYLGRELRRPRGSRRWRFITLVRDLLAQNISSFFQIIDVLVPGLAQGRTRVDMDRLKGAFLEHYGPDCLFNHWFERELGPVLGIDVYASPFPRSQGYRIYRGERVEVLLLRLESLNDCAGEAMKEFLGIEGFRLRNKNLGDTKPYSDLYRRFRETVALPKSHVDAVYALPQARHFYTEEEIEGFKSRYRIEAP